LSILHRNFCFFSDAIKFFSLRKLAALVSTLQHFVN